MRPSQVLELAEAMCCALPPLDAEEQRIAISLYRQLATGRPVPPTATAGASGASLDRVEKALGRWPAVFCDEKGSVVGFWGLTVAEMRSPQILAEGVSLWAWCAWDTLFLPELLATTVQIVSVAPGGEETIELRVAPDRVESVAPGDAVVSFLKPDAAFDNNVIARFCHFVHFFPSQAAGEVWVDDHPGTFVLSLRDAFELARISNRRFAAALDDPKLSDAVAWH
jgi:alkylmercury lyase